MEFGAELAQIMFFQGCEETLVIWLKFVTMKIQNRKGKLYPLIGNLWSQTEEIGTTNGSFDVKYCPPKKQSDN